MIDFLFNRTPLYFMTQNLWKDEAFSYLLAKREIWDIIGLTARDFNPPFYYLLLHYWMKIFGVGELALRSLSLVFFMLTIYAAFLFLQNIIRVRGRRIWAYLLLFGLNPGLLYFAFEARMYSLFALLALLSFYFFWQKRKKAYIISTILVLYTHYFFIFVLAGQWLHQAIIYRKKSLHHNKYLLTPLIFTLPWLVYITPAFIKKTSQFWISKLSLVDVISSVGVLFTGYERLYGFYNDLIIPLSLLLIFFLVFYSRRPQKQPRLFLMLAIWSLFFYVIIVLASLIWPVFVFRYLTFANVGLNLLIFYLLEQGPRKTRLMILLLLLFINVHYLSFEVIHRRKDNIRQVIREIKILAAPDDLLYVTDPTLYFPASYYFGEQGVYVNSEKPIPDYIGAVIIPEEKVARQLPIFPQKAFILKKDHTYEIQAVR